MELTLTNFRFHRKAKFLIPIDGMILIRGDGGKGKTTIFNAICFVLYGKQKKPFSHGSKTCKVELSIKSYDLEISRAKLPSNKLTVVHKNQNYEGDSAQGIIDSIIGVNSEEFYISSYFDQRKQMSILSMTPAEQLSYIETIAFGQSDNYEQDRNLIKERIKTLDNSKTKLEAKYELLKTQVSACQETLSKFGNNDENIDFVDIEAVKTQKDELNVILQKKRSELKEKRRVVEELVKVEKDQKKLAEDRAKYETQLKVLIDQKNNLGVAKTENEIIQMRDLSEKLSLRRKQLEFHEQAKILEAEFDHLSEKHYEASRKKIAELKSSIIPNEELADVMSKLENYEKLKLEYDENERIKNEYEKHKNEHSDLMNKIRTDLIKIDKVQAKNITPNLTSIKKNIQPLIANHTKKINQLEIEIDALKCNNLSCPSCSAVLKLTEGNLILVEEISDVQEKSEKKKTNPVSKPRRSLDIAEPELLTVKENLARLQNYVSISDSSHNKIGKTPRDLKMTIMSLKEFQALSIRVSENESKQLELGKLEEKLKNKVLPDFIRRIRMQIKEKRKGLPENLDTSLTRDELSEQIKKLDVEVNTEWNIKGNISKLSRDISSIEKILNELPGGQKFLKNKSDISVADTIMIHDTEIKKIESDIDSLSTQNEELNVQLCLAESYAVYNHAKKELASLIKDRDDVSNEIDDVMRHLEGAHGLEKANIEAEFISLEKTLGSINEHAKIYLAALFRDPIIANLKIKRITKKGDTVVRPTIDIEVIYQGEVYDDIDEFCGSERQRVDLAFLFAVNDMLGSKILLLDECFNNLDSEMRTTTIGLVNHIATEFKKHTLVISHDSVEGVYTHVVDIQ